MTIDSAHEDDLYRYIWKMIYLSMMTISLSEAGGWWGIYTTPVANAPSVWC